jgi:hypothetical protein
VAYSDYQQDESAPQDLPAPLGRPSSLGFGFVAALLAGACSILGSVLLITGAHRTAEGATRAIVSGTVLDGSDFAKGVIDDAARTLIHRGLLSVLFGAIVVVFALRVRNGALGTRITLTIFLLCSALTDVDVVRDVAPGATKALDVAAIVLSAPAAIALFLPRANHRARDRPL